MKFDLNEAIEILERTPPALNSLLENLSSCWTQQNEGPDTWSPFDVVGHLIHGEKTDWIVRVDLILGSNPNKNFEPFDRFAQLTDSKEKSLNELLTEFSILRKANLEKLKSHNINAEDLLKEGIHPEFGKVTLKHLLATWVSHDLNHIYQIVRVMVKLYKGETGPWPKYIRLLNE